MRSAPYSKFNPQFNRETFANFLKSRGINYVFLGKELGARSNDPTCYVDGKMRYDLLEKTALFQSGIERVITGAEDYRIALMCAEKDPLDCHRTILVARALEKCGLRVVHILSDGSLERHEDTIDRLLTVLKMPEADFFKTKNEIISDAYEARGKEIAYEKRKTVKGENQDVNIGRK